MEATWKVLGLPRATMGSHGQPWGNHGQWPNQSRHGHRGRRTLSSTPCLRVGVPQVVPPRAKRAYELPRSLYVYEVCWIDGTSLRTLNTGQTYSGSTSEALQAQQGPASRRAGSAGSHIYGPFEHARRETLRQLKVNPRSIASLSFKSYGVELIHQHLALGRPLGAHSTWAVLRLVQAMLANML